MSILEEYAAWKAGLTRAVEAALATDVAPWVKEEMRFHVKQQVYGAYAPEEYIRREDEGGMSDIRNYRATVEPGTMTLTVENLTMGNPEYAPPWSQGWDSGYISDLIQEGTGYHWTGSKIYRKMPYPRPYIDEAEQEVVRSGTVEWALEKGLRERGYDVRKE